MLGGPYEREGADAMTGPVATLQEPYAPLPADAKADEVERYLRNFARAVADRAASGHLGPLEQLVREEISLYLASNYDPRPLDQVAADVRAVIQSQVARR
jgi:hypothetical protein